MSTRPLEAMAPQAPFAGTHTRKAHILRAAVHAFAANGFRGSSLRDIAAAAGVSLTLVDHHFGSKERLLAAVVARHHEACKERLAGLRARLLRPGAPMPMSMLVEEWVRNEFEVYASPDGRRYLLLMLALANEGELDDEVRRRLDCSEPLIVHALALAAPGSSQADRTLAFRLASSTLLAAIRELDPRAREGQDDESDQAIRASARFIAAGLSASLVN